ncbi:MAG TPA: hypothetical protein VHX37_09355 [Acidobacteriaceae bacterium]|jgi:hypothetical protein|nr:hypothetical protein [Acidobacteriaceae bacterium]
MFGDDPIEFSPDGAALVDPVCQGQTDNLWLQTLNRSPGRQVTDFTSEFIRDCGYSADGRQPAIIRGHQQADGVLIRDTGK